jgi:hypothetical protein
MQEMMIKRNQRNPCFIQLLTRMVTDNRGKIGEDSARDVERDSTGLKGLAVFDLTLYPL